MPADWDEREKIPDPEAVKPEDWDEVIFHNNPVYKLTISNFFSNVQAFYITIVFLSKTIKLKALPFSP